MDIYSLDMFRDATIEEARDFVETVIKEFSLPLRVEDTQENLHRHPLVRIEASFRCVTTEAKPPSGLLVGKMYAEKERKEWNVVLPRYYYSEGEKHAESPWVGGCDYAALLLGLFEISVAMFPLYIPNVLSIRADGSPLKCVFFVDERQHRVFPVYTQDISACEPLQFKIIINDGCKRPQKEESLSLILVENNRLKLTPKEWESAKDWVAATISKYMEMAKSPAPLSIDDAVSFANYLIESYELPIAKFTASSGESVVREGVIFERKKKSANWAGSIELGYIYGGTAVCPALYLISHSILSTWQTQYFLLHEAAIAGALFALSMLPLSKYFLARCHLEVRNEGSTLLLVNEKGKVIATYHIMQEGKLISRRQWDKVVRKARAINLYEKL